MAQELWDGFGIHPDELEEQGYAERCAETFRQILRDEHRDYFGEEFDAFWSWTPEDEELAERVGLGEFEEH